MITETALSDAKLVEKTVAGDIGAYTMLIRRYQNQVLSTAFLYMKNSAEAEELAQDALIKAHEKLNSLKDPSRFAGWLRKLVIRICLDAIRRKGPGKIPIDIASAGDIATGGQEEIEEELYREQVRREVAGAVDSLSEKLREVVILYYFRDLSYKEIGEYLNLSIRTVESRLYKAKILLHRKLSQLHEEGGLPK